MASKTFRLRKNDLSSAWHVLDAEGRPLGRLATEVAALLLGKHKPTYEPHLVMGDHVVVVNAELVKLTGNKSTNKVYYRHSGYPGGLRERTFEEQMDRDPRRVVETAVRGMLPHNARGRELFRRLKVYSGPEHPHEAQVMAGTGVRARKRATLSTDEVSITGGDSTPAEVASSVLAGATDSPARTGPLSRWRRAELDLEAERLGIEIMSEWKKADVITAIEARRQEDEVVAEPQSE